MIFKMLKEMSDETGGEHNRLTSHVLSASMKVEVWNDMYKPFTLVFKNAEVRLDSYLLRCKRRDLGRAVTDSSLNPDAFYIYTVPLRDDRYLTYRKNSVELIELTRINTFRLFGFHPVVTLDPCWA